MKNPHKHSDFITGCQTVTGPPDEEVTCFIGQDATVGGHTGTVIEDDPYGAKTAKAQGIAPQIPADPGSPEYEPSENDIVIQTKIPNKRPRFQ